MERRVGRIRSSEGPVGVRVGNRQRGVDPCRFVEAIRDRGEAVVGKALSLRRRANRIGPQAESPAVRGLSRTSGAIRVLPVMTSGGYYAEWVLGRIARGPASDRAAPVQVIPAVGTRPEVAPLVASWARDQSDRSGRPAAETRVVLVGHGTRRARASQDSTQRMAAYLRRKRWFRDVVPAFLDADPELESTFRDRAHHLVLPFLVGGGGHAGRDLPRRIRRVVGSTLPFLGRPIGDLRGWWALTADIASRELGA